MSPNPLATGGIPFPSLMTCITTHCRPPKLRSKYNYNFGSEGVNTQRPFNFTFESAELFSRTQQLCHRRFPLVDVNPAPKAHPLALRGPDKLQFLFMKKVPSCDRK